jgi:hypothetical protein
MCNIEKRMMRQVQNLFVNRFVTIVTFFFFLGDGILLALGFKCFRKLERVNNGRLHCQ